MGLLDGLFKLFPALKKVNLKALNNIRFSINIGNRYETKNDNRTLIINPQKLSKKEREELYSRLPKSLEEGADILEESFEKKTEDYQSAIGQSDQSEILTFFQDKIPSADIPILKASLYLKHLLDTGKSTSEIKQDIIVKYGQRGKSISNLCSANYFRTWSKPLYEEMSKAGSTSRFIEAYNEIVENQPFTVFVNIGMNEGEVKKVIQEKVGLMQKYGFENLYIHGIGETNVNRIRKAVVELLKEGSFTKSILEEGSIIVVTLRKVKTQ